MFFHVDLARAVRQLVAAPLFALTAIGSLSVGIAASSTIVSLAESLLTPSAGVRDVAGLVEVGRSTDGRGFDNMSHPAFTYLREHATTLDGLAAHRISGEPVSVTLGPTSERAFGMVVSANYFDVLRTRMTLGRGFRADEDVTPGEGPVVVVSHRFWTRRLGADPTVLARPLRINTQDFTVVGVAEPGFEGVSFAGTDLWMPTAMVAVAQGLATPSLLTSPRAVWHTAIGRRRPGVSRAQVHAELNTLMAQFREATPEANPRHTVATAAASRLPGPMRTPFLVFLGALLTLTVAFLAIACSNVAGLLLARAAARRREIATRLALGASRGRLLTQLLAETAVLFTIAALLALPLTAAGIRVLAATVDGGLPVLLNLEPRLSPRVVAYAFGIALATALLFGLAPARHALAANLAPLLHGATATGDRGRRRGRQVLVAAQVALAVMLVATAGLFVRSLANAARLDPGFSTADTTLVSLDLSLSGYRDEAAAAVSGPLQARLAALPGVISVATARMIPLQGGGFGLGRLRVPGAQGARSDDVVDADWNVVSPEYFATIGMRLVEGRAFRATDEAGALRVAIVNETFARQAWPGRSAIGQRVLHLEDESREVPLEVVGVAADAKYRYLSEDAAPHVYVPAAQHPQPVVTFYVRHAPGAAPAEATARAAIAEIDRGIPVLQVQSFDAAVALGLLPQRVTAWIAGLVGSAGALLAAFGLYGVMAYLVTQRTREIAIRLALGASTAAIRRLVLQDATALFAAGALAGLALAAGTTTALGSLLIGVGPHDALTYGGTIGAFGVVLGTAAYLPARRAAATDPARTLRAE